MSYSYGSPFQVRTNDQNYDIKSQNYEILSHNWQIQNYEILGHNYDISQRCKMWSHSFDVL